VKVTLQIEELMGGTVAFSTMLPSTFPEWPVAGDRQLPTALRLAFRMSEAAWVEAGRPLSLVVELADS
jgi:hypothetical protein